MSGLEKPSVCHIASGDRWAGAEAQISSLLRELAARNEFRLSAIVLNEGRLASELRESGVEVLVLPESSLSLAQLCRRTTQFLRPRSCQILHSHRYKENVIAAVVGWSAAVPFRIRTQHGMTEPFRGWRAVKHAFAQAVDTAVLWGTDRVVAVSSDMRERLQRRAGGRVVLIPNGIDTDRVRSTLSNAEAKQRLGLSPESWVIGFVGRLEPVKRLDLFLNAMSLISPQVPEARFVIAGEGNMEGETRDLAKTLALESRTQFLGHRDDVFDVLRALDVFVLCSDHEGLPMTLLEAMYLQVPVVARAVGGVTDVLEDGRHGLLVRTATARELADTCRKVRSADRQKLTGEAMRQVLENFSAKASARATAAMYRESMPAPRKG